MHIFSFFFHYWHLSLLVLAILGMLIYVFLNPALAPLAMAFFRAYWPFLLVIILLSCAAVWWGLHNYDLGREEGKKVEEGLHTSINQLQAAQRLNLSTITDLRKANEDWARAGKEATQREGIALQQLQADRGRIQTLSNTNAARRRKIYATDSSSKEWGERGVPADIARSLLNPPPSDSN